MTIAITPFEGLCGFRPLAEIVHSLKAIEPLRTLIGEQATSEFEKIVKGNEESEDEAVVQRNKDALRSVFTSLMESPSEKIEAASKALVALAESSPASFGTLPEEVETNPSDPAELAAACAVVLDGDLLAGAGHPPRRRPGHAGNRWC